MKTKRSKIAEFLVKTLMWMVLALFFLRLPAQKPFVQVMFWNVENYFDPFADSVRQDPAFTPMGDNHWTWKRFIAKRDAIAKAVIAAGKGNPPVILGLCEVESRFALEQLARETLLAQIGYKVIHRDGQDARGIDVALLYRPDCFEPLERRFLRVRFANATQHTREILYVKGVLEGLDTLHLWVNHWPSKWGGAKVSTPRRMSAALRLRASVDSVFAKHPNANILIMGDFNDGPFSDPITEGLGALPVSLVVSSESTGRRNKPSAVGAALYNLTAPIAVAKKGSIRFRGKWELIDQFIVSGHLMNPQEPISTSAGLCSLFDAPFLLTPDETYLGLKPYRSYLGPRYQGGISDHLPIMLKIERNY